MLTVHQGNSLEILPTLPADSFDSCVTDPPYELRFMSAKWDSTGIAYNVDLWREVLRVLKPGAHLLAFGGSRTYHRMACAIEDAGFEIRDQIDWLYGQGFPKSVNIAKHIDRKDGRLGWQSPNAGNYGGDGGGLGTRPGNKHRTETFTVEIESPAAQRWQGWGTSLKPSHEPIVLARKPLSEPTIAANILKWGVGGLNVDGCRVATNGELLRTSTTTVPKYGKHADGRGSACMLPSKTISKPSEQHTAGRWPPNTLFSHLPECGEGDAGDCADGCAVAELGRQSGVSKSNVRPPTGKPLLAVNDGGRAVKWNPNSVMDTTERGHADTGTAARFFPCFRYEAKASRKDRGEFNTHATVKPTALMQWLVRLVTPPEGVVLDPFAGSGTTLVACEREGFSCIGIELEPVHCEIIHRRIA